MEIKKLISYTIASKRIKHLGTNLTKNICVLKYSSLMKELNKREW